MKLFPALAITAVMTLGACVTDTGDAAKPAASANVMTPLVGKTLVGDDVTFIVNADGTMGGVAQGKPVVGVYKATAKESCSTYTSPDFLKGREFCSVPTITGNTVVFNRRDGTTSQVYKIQG